MTEKTIRKKLTYFQLTLLRLLVLIAENRWGFTDEDHQYLKKVRWELGLEKR